MPPGKPPGKAALPEKKARKKKKEPLWRVALPGKFEACFENCKKNGLPIRFLKKGALLVPARDGNGTMLVFPENPEQKDRKIRETQEAISLIELFGAGFSGLGNVRIIRASGDRSFSNTGASRAGFTSSAPPWQAAYCSLPRGTPMPPPSTWRRAIRRLAHSIPGTCPTRHGLLSNNTGQTPSGHPNPRLRRR